MAWNPSPEVAVAREAAKKLNAPICIMLYVTENNSLGMASYGKTKELCKHAGTLGDKVFDFAMKEILKSS